ncbi:MAG: RnfABCDGE type electron transport complex subunit B [Desulfosarcina sp.]|nr:RnfABCDGE type electron transport complex subunit B [Desulfobacterales bacterium]
MTYALFVMGGLGLVIGVILAAASKIFYVYVDPLILAVEDALPGANCGGCGLPGCSSNAEAIVSGKAAPNSCVAAGPEVAEAIAEILGVKVEAKEPDVASPGCTYGVKDADIKYIYDGLDDCKAAALLNGGMKVCSIGCLGLGSCVKACQFGALSMGPDGLPVVDEERCTGCGACERTCPKGIINLLSVTRRILREYTTGMCTTPCQRACPAGIDICEYIKQINLGDYHKAVQVIKERLPFPSVIGRICPRFCEDDCRRKYIDEPVAINFLKRFVADFERKNGERLLPYKAPETDRRIAVIGGGVEGLSTAFFTARLGHEVTVFEASDVLGGLLRSAIHRQRLSMGILDWDIDGVLEMGVTAETNKALGKDFSVASLLKDGFESVFVASGGWDSRLAGGSAKDSDREPGSDFAEAIPGTSILLDVIKSGRDGKGGFSCKTDVVIAGGAELAFEAARICKKLGAKKINILFRETRKACKINAAELEKIEKEKAVNIIFNVGISGISGEEDNLLELEYTELDSMKKKNIPAQTLIVSSGRLPELIFADADANKEDDAEPQAGLPIKWKGVEPYKTSADKSFTGIFSDVDALTDYSAAIKAIAAGRRAAASIHQILYGIRVSVPENLVTPQSLIQNVNHLEAVKAVPRVIMPLSSTPDPETAEELEKGFSEDMARKEAARGLQCGLICYKKTADETAIAELNKAA